jgi:hypothetical protein
MPGKSIRGLYTSNDRNAVVKREAKQVIINHISITMHYTAGETKNLVEAGKAWRTDIPGTESGLTDLLL